MNKYLKQDLEMLQKLLQFLKDNNIVFSGEVIGQANNYEVYTTPISYVVEDDLEQEVLSLDRT